MYSWGGVYKNKGCVLLRHLNKKCPVMERSDVAEVTTAEPNLKDDPSPMTFKFFLEKSAFKIWGI